eukprot:CAMPEP_0182448054 /NCGR_PEP_ID=MMETSP1172-20130603/23145_1 /TAXON_ID=708627 /ORGANISM="Timspurckia oligopyrenoides, Strain CCMP3278" /LENGTH=274 /DNA_ID=CAMNT_0024644771 /DNA_START=326 /DNA_END=1150 /DNA_ORIENTATION=+
MQNVETRTHRLLGIDVMQLAKEVDMCFQKLMVKLLNVFSNVADKRHQTVLFIDNFDVVFVATDSPCPVCSNSECKSDKLGAILIRKFSELFASRHISVVATSTPKAFERYVAQRWKIPRSSRLILLREMTEAETFNLMRERKHELEQKYGVRVRDLSMKFACVLSAKLAHRNLPERALAVMESTCENARYLSLGSMCTVSPIDVAELIALWTDLSLEHVLEQVHHVLLYEQTRKYTRKTSSVALHALTDKQAELRLRRVQTNTALSSSPPIRTF